ncbi:MAG: 3'(2'),5'-bisphosphate nucleotidase CysQ [Caulobacterales bacterium]|nr:3'(2'),5'-bisphosphate nucleotidase CysQ [Caulobacterales bacterium]
MNLLNDLELAKSAAIKTGDMVMTYFNKPIEVIEKSPNNPVTEADYKADELLQTILKVQRPEYGWLSEETKDDGSRFENSKIWMVDPIDGTRAFIKGLPHFTISIALIENGDAVLGVIYNPATGEMFNAAKNNGAYKNNKPILSSNSSQLSGAKMLGDKNMFSSKSWPTQWPEMIIEQRNSIAYRMALVASGEFDAAIATAPKNYWDVAAGTIILKEANGKITDHKGQEFHFDRNLPLQKSLVASNLNLHTELLSRLSHIE